jgi:DNA-binding NtrC family response regulator
MARGLADWWRRVEAGIGNPFLLPAGGFAKLVTELAQAPLTELVSDALERGAMGDAKRALLAVGHAEACLSPGEPKSVLASSRLPERTWRSFPRTRVQYQRVVLAAGRCHRALSALSGSSEPMTRVRRETWSACFGESLHHALHLEQVIRDHDVLILGETGTGKESVARGIQVATPGADIKAAPSAALNVAAVPETLVESELFGHVKGAFTGANETRVGRIRSAAGGCLFLDEIGDLSLTAQVKLLRVMETNEVTPVGSDVPHDADVRYVAATHQDLRAMVDAGRFRRDLLERLAGNVIRVPPLRERVDDIPEIGLAFVKRHGEAIAEVLDLGRIEAWLSGPDARAHSWPGNVRELENTLRNLMLGLEVALPEPHEPEPAAPAAPGRIGRGAATLKEVTDWYVRRVLEATGGNVSRAARVLGVDRTTLMRRRSARTR